SAVGRIGLEIQNGSFVGVMGASGAGKSALLNVLFSIDKPTSGEIEIGGKQISTMNGKELAVFRRDQLGFIFQDYNLLDTMTVKDNIVLPLALARIKQAEIDQR
ncbi:ATP-binding cassette domain-containing protein, partial [Escherichia coli]|nr:ATP-binding cassette domain-containing protein [Escherichia coli]